MILLSAIIEYNNEQINVPVIDGKIKYTFTATSTLPPKLLRVEDCDENTKLKNIQLEHGSDATPFVAPEIIPGEPSGLIKDIEDKADRIDLNNVIETISVTSDKVADIETTVETTKNNHIITHSSEYITTIEKLVGNADNADEQLKVLQQLAETIDTYFVFDDAFTIGKSNAKTKVRIDNEQLQFLDGETIIAYMSGVYTVMQNARIEGSLEFKNHKITDIGENTVVLYIGE